MRASRPRKRQRVELVHFPQEQPRLVRWPSHVGEPSSVRRQRDHGVCVEAWHGRLSAGNATFTRVTSPTGAGLLLLQIQRATIASSTAAAASPRTTARRVALGSRGRRGRQRSRSGRGRCNCRSRGRRGRRRRIGREWRNEAIAAAVHGLNERGLLRIVAQGLANEPHGFGERVSLTCASLPREIHQRLFRDDAAGALDEMLEDRHRARRQADLFAGARQQPVGEVEPERPEVDDRSRAGMEAQRARRIVIRHERDCIDRQRRGALRAAPDAQVRKKSARGHPGRPPFVFCCPPAAVATACLKEEDTMRRVMSAWSRPSWPDCSR